MHLIDHSMPGSYVYVHDSAMKPFSWQDLAIKDNNEVKSSNR